MYFCIAILVFAAWVCGLAMVSSISQEPLKGNNPSHGDQGKNLVWSQSTYWMVFAMWVMIIWMMTFIMASN